MLQLLGLLNSEGGITERGKQARLLGIHPRLGAMVLHGRELGLGTAAAEIAALLGERDLPGPGYGADLHERLRLLHGELELRVDRRRLQAVRQAARQLYPRGVKQAVLPGAEETGLLLALAWPDRIARRRPGQNGNYQLSNGKGASLRAGDQLLRYEWLAIAELDGQSRQASIYLAAPLRLADLEQHLAGLIVEQESADWDEQRGTVVVRRSRRLGQLLLSTKECGKAQPQQIQQALLQAVRERGLDSLPWSASSRQWRARVAMLAQLFPGDWPDVADDSLLAELEHWLAPFMHGMQRWSDLQQLDLHNALSSLLDHAQQQQLQRLAPVSLEIPTGQQIRLDYCAENGPVLAAKLQALFGWSATPRVADGRVAVLLHLLSPAQRPLAVTADLASFWRNAYPEVRKDMRGRYPRHPWPEDPLTALPQQGAKRKGK